jgi:hypothetical protein
MSLSPSHQRGSPQPIQNREALMRALEILSQQMEIFHRGRDLRVAEDDREAHNVATVAEVLGRKGVTPIPYAE